MNPALHLSALCSDQIVPDKVVVHFLTNIQRAVGEVVVSFLAFLVVVALLLSVDSPSVVQQLPQ